MAKKRKYRNKRKRAKTFIYEIRAGDFFYIGKSNSPWRRLEAHKEKAIKNLGRNAKKNRIFKKNLHKLRLKIIEKPRMKDWRKREIYWIKYYRQKYGYDRVLNATEGGDGASGGGHKDKKRKKRSKSPTNPYLYLGFGLFILVLFLNNLT